MKTKTFLIFNSAFLILNFFLSGCKKPEDLGLAVLPNSDLLNAIHIDTCTVIVRTLREDSLRADELSRLLLGSYVDPEFGVVEGGIYTQLLLSSTPVLKSDTPSVLAADSVVLSLAYIGSYGDTSSPQTVHVYPLTQDMNVDSVYYSNTTFTADANTDLANSLTFTPHPYDSVQVDTIKQPAQLRIRLNSQALTDSLLALTAGSTNDIWKSSFKGVYIKVDAATISKQGAILYFDPGSPYSKMTLYYKETGPSGTVRKTYDLLLDGARVNHETHNYNGYPVGQLLANSTANDTTSYLQSMSGLKDSITFPYLKHLTDSGKVIINKAELVISANVDALSPYSPPTDLFLSAYDSTGKINFVIDYFEGNFGGTINVSNNTYKFNVSRQLQQILDGKLSDYGFSLNILSSGVQADRVIIGSGKGSTYKMKLNLFYTKLK